MALAAQIGGIWRRNEEGALVISVKAAAA